MLPLDVVGVAALVAATAHLTAVFLLALLASARMALRASIIAAWGGAAICLVLAVVSVATTPSADATASFILAGAFYAICGHVGAATRDGDSIDEN